MPATPLRNVRVPDEVWRLATARARLDGEPSLSAVIVAMLRRYGEAADPVCGRPYADHSAGGNCPA